MTARHADLGQHLPRHEAKNVTAKYWSIHRDSVWASDRAVPLGVTGGQS